MDHLVIASFVFLNLFMVLGAVDLFYFHIWKYKLHTRPESRYEHKLHMAFAFLMVPLAYLLYYQNFGGWALWAGAFFVVAALSTELADVFSENDSRASISGVFRVSFRVETGGGVVPFFADRVGRVRIRSGNDGVAGDGGERVGRGSALGTAAPEGRPDQLPDRLRCGGLHQVLVLYA
jgi:hypothetical protein